MINKKILVIIDTNSLGNYSSGEIYCKNYSYLDINRYLHENIVNNFNSSGDISIQIAIPQMVLEELKFQQKSSFENKKKNLGEDFKKFNGLPNSEIKLPDLDYDSYLDEKASAYLGVYGIKEIKNPSKSVSNKLIERVLQRDKPFYKKGKKLDSGFKDNIIWESILEFVSENSYDKYFFLSNDSDFEDEKLRKEFIQIAGKELYIVKEVADLKGKLEEEIKGTEVINNALKHLGDFLFHSLEDIIHRYHSEIFLEGDVRKIINIEQYNILDITVNEDGFILPVLVYFKHESLYSVYAQHGAFDQAYINDTEVSPIKITLFFDKSYNLKKLNSKELLLNGQEESIFN